MTQYIQSGEPVLISPHLKLGSIIPPQSHTANHWSNRIEILSAYLDLENEEAIDRTCVTSALERLNQMYYDFFDCFR